jgi:hypothetical protein
VVLWVGLAGIDIWVVGFTLKNHKHHVSWAAFNGGRLSYSKAIHELIEALCPGVHASSSRK